MLHSHALRSGGRDSALFANALQKVRAALEIDPLQPEFRQTCAALLLDMGRSLLMRAVAERSKTALRQAVERLREASKLDMRDSGAARAIFELARHTLERVPRPCAIYGAGEEMLFEAAHQLLELLGPTAAGAVSDLCDCELSAS